MQKLLITVAAALLSTLISISWAMADQEIFRWVDEDGIVHFGDRLPEGVEADAISVRPNIVQSVPAKQPLAVQTGDEIAAGDLPVPILSRAEQSRQDRAKIRRKNAEKARILEANCATMRRQKEFIEPSSRVLVDDGNGGTRRLEDSEPEEALSEANTYLAANCN